MSIQLSPTKFIDVFFNILEEKAKDPNVTDQDIVDNIGNFLIRTKYIRSVYEMHFSGFHRARCQSFDSIEDACKEFGNVSGLSCPPPERVSRPSRCNLPGVSVFYCSPDSGVTIFEVRPSLGQYVVLSRFTPKQGDRFEMLLPIIGVKQIRSSFSTRDPNDPIFSLLAKDLHFKGTHKFILEIDDRIAHYFVQPVNDSNQYIYRISTGFYNAFKEYGDMGEDEINSLLYPSVESRVTGFNIVIEPQVLSNNANLN